MPKFILNENGNASKSYYELDTFSKAYVEAMFFTNGDTGDENEDSLNEIGVEGLTPESVANIAKDCAEFQESAAEFLIEAYERGYSIEQAGADFWFTRQGHGVGFWDRGELEGGLGKTLSDISKGFGTAYVEIGDDGLIHY